MDARDKYLIFDTINVQPAGLEHKLSTLRCAISEAIYLNRILVLRKFAISSIHNYAYDEKFKADLIKNDKVENENMHYLPEYALKKINFKSYLNLAKTRVYKLEDDGGIVEITELFRYIDEKDFDLKAYTNQPELVIKSDRLVTDLPPNTFTEINNQVLIAETNRPISKEQNNQYQVIVRRTNAYKYAYTPAARDLLTVLLYPSSEVEQLVDIVLKSIGTSLQRVKNRYAFYYQAATTEILNNYRIRFSQQHPIYYACLHMRKNDMYYKPTIKYAASKSNIKRMVEQALPKKSIIYVMSDTADLNYFDFLRKDYTVYQYFNFPELKALVSCKNREQVDNAMLYAVEKNILKYAHIQIIYRRGRPDILYTNQSYSIPWRHRLMAIYDYVLSDILTTNFLYGKKRDGNMQYIKRILEDKVIH
ncbi:MAG: hypothetical protein GDA45_04685 [Chromatiales bacterium]|nr:hypothetical protein [Chromatiales bacterium]